MSNIYYFTFSNYGSRNNSLEIFEGEPWEGILKLVKNNVLEFVSPSPPKKNKGVGGIFR